MKTVTVSGKEFRLIISSEEIKKRIKRIAGEISSDMAGSDPLFIGILNGSFMFAAELFKNLSIDSPITFIKVASYDGSQTSGRVEELIGLNQNIEGRHVIILEDIIDTGGTIEVIRQSINALKPASLRIASLLFKPTAVKMDVKIDYVGFKIPDNFVIGYGLDYNGYGRKYQDIYSLITEA